MKLVLISTSMAVVLLAVAISHVLPSMSGVSKTREYAQWGISSPVRN